jgi:AraC family transcriptional regulator of adaptative response/methylated-DNA-[protein]-cysteine methyltransferase
MKYSESIALSLKGISHAFSANHGSGKAVNKLNAKIIETPVGNMLAIANNSKLLMLDFVDTLGLQREINRTQNNYSAKIIWQRAEPIKMIENELKNYFANKIFSFKTPIEFIGTDFQRSVYGALEKIPFGHKKSYGEIAKHIKKPLSFRAVAQACGSNQKAGTLGGYDGGTQKKAWLLAHEKIKIR